MLPGITEKIRSLVVFPALLSSGPGIFSGNLRATGSGQREGPVSGTAAPPPPEMVTSVPKIRP